jgi:hypothetical protein
VTILVLYLFSIKGSCEDLFSESQTPGSCGDIEDIGHSAGAGNNSRPVSNKRKRQDDVISSRGNADEELSKSWKEILGAAPPMGKNKVGDWLFTLLHICSYMLGNN